MGRVLFSTTESDLEQHDKLVKLLRQNHEVDVVLGYDELLNSLDRIYGYDAVVINYDVVPNSSSTPKRHSLFDDLIGHYISSMWKTVFVLTGATIEHDRKVIASYRFQNIDKPHKDLVELVEKVLS